MKTKIPKLKIPTIEIYGIDVIKNFLFFTIFIILTLLSIGLIIAPSIKIFKTHQTQFYKTKFEYNSLKKTYNEKKEELSKLKKESNKIIKALNTDFEKNDFIKFASKFMKIEKIKEINSTMYKKDFIKTSYMINGYIKTPKNFYDFIDALKNYKYIIRAYFPVNFEKKDKLINIQFKIEHYKVKK